MEVLVPALTVRWLIQSLVRVEYRSAMMPLDCTAFRHSTFVARHVLISANIGARRPMACVPNVLLGSTRTTRATCLDAR